MLEQKKTNRAFLSWYGSFNYAVWSCFFFCFFYTPSHNTCGVLWFHVGRLCVHPSVHPSVCHLSARAYFCFQMITWANINEFSPNLVYVLILRRSGLGFLMGKLYQFLTELSASHMIVVGCYRFILMFVFLINSIFILSSFISDYYSNWIIKNSEIVTAC